MFDFDFNSGEPIYRQVAEQIEEAVINGSFPEGTQIPSTTEISNQFHINPATVLKGMNMLVANGLIEKKRGVGMFVVQGAQETVKDARRATFFEKEIQTLVKQAKSLSISETELLKMISKGYEQ
ncbi:GntR family transcriptional regulator [Lentilactobacillus senioris]|uniref:GntR family transcriptional regulator n=1 Tax=Lentilactobacillus senioris TaxID=931534 RepID=UPI003D2E1ABC